MKSSFTRILLLSLLVPLSGQAATFLNDIVATVDQSVITRFDLTQERDLVVKQLVAKGVAVPSPAALEHQVLERMIQQQVQINLAESLGIRVSDDQVNRVLAGLAQQNQLSLEQFRQRLEKEEGLGYGQFYEGIRRSLIQQRLEESQLSSRVKVTQTDLDIARSQTQSEEWNIAQILIQTPEGLSAAELEAKKARAQMVRERLLKGAAFAQVAAEFSDDVGAIRNGGVWGWRLLNRLPVLFVDALAQRKPGELSEVVRSPNGFHILKLLDKRAVDRDAEKVLQTHVRHILLRINAQQSASTALLRIENVKSMLDSKQATFADLAAQYSADASAGQGGDLGWLLQGETVPAFEREMNELPVNVVSAPVLTPFGYHLIEVLERKTDVLPAERRDAQLRASLYSRKYEEARESWLSQLRGQSLVEIFLD